jgi:hypothetical protein
LKNIDIIIPAALKTPGLFFSRLKLLNTDWYPVFLNQKGIEELGYKIRFFNVFNLPPKEVLSDTIIIDSRVRRNLVGKSDATVQQKREIFAGFISKLKTGSRSIILFDTSDTCTIQFYLLPHVALYCKKQLFKDSSVYEYNLYDSRLFADYYDKKYRISRQDGSFFKSTKNNQYDIYLENKHKIRISWNILLAISNYLNSFAKTAFVLGKNFYLKYGSTNTSKKYIISGNFYKDYKKPSAAFQRKKLHQLLSNHNLSERFTIGTVPKKQYRRNIFESEFVVSPFGWGEVCYRDFEAFIAGAALIKPDMGHINTWPDLYVPGRTYYPISWDFKNWDEQFNAILSDDKKRKEMAKYSQEQFKNLWSKARMQHFCERFVELIDI